MLGTASRSPDSLIPLLARMGHRGRASSGWHPTEQEEEGREEGIQVLEASGGKAAGFFPLSSVFTAPQMAWHLWEGSGHAPSRRGARGRPSRMPSVPAEIKPGLHCHLLLEYDFFFSCLRAEEIRAFTGARL